MGEYGPGLSEEEALREAQTTRRLAQELAAMDNEERPSPSHYQEALEVIDSERKSDPDRIERIIDHDQPNELIDA